MVQFSIKRYGSHGTNKMPAITQSGHLIVLLFLLSGIESNGPWWCQAGGRLITIYNTVILNQKVHKWRI